jgi:hypothetical protein
MRYDCALISSYKIMIKVDIMMGAGDRSWTSRIWFLEALGERAERILFSRGLPITLFQPSGEQGRECSVVDKSDQGRGRSGRSACEHST